MGLDILGIAESALSAFQTGVAISSKNIADSADPDYCREIVECSTMLGGDLSVSVKRISDHFITTQMNQSQSDLSCYTASSTIATSLDQFITGLNGTDSSGTPANLLSQNLQSFFDSLNSLSSSVDTSNRQAVISQASLLTSTLKDASNYLDQQQDSAQANITSSINQINTITQQIGKLNEKIDKFDAGNVSPDLLDQRDKLVSQLSQYVGVNVTENGNMINVALKGGSSLVTGTTVSKMGSQRDGFGDKVQITLSGVALTSTQGQSLSGSLGGYLDARNTFIPELRDKIGLLTATLTYKFNEQNQAGYLSTSTTGTPVHGGNIFNPDYSATSSSYSNAAANTDNTGDAELGAQITDPTKLQASSYTVTEVSAGNYQIVNDTTGSTETFSSFPFTTSEGLKISKLSGATAVGDSFKINLMSGSLRNLSLVAGPNDIATSSNADGTGNGNINALASLGTEKIFGNGANDFTQQLAATYSDIGTSTSSYSDSYSSAKAAFTQANNDKQSLSGVNTQEEYTNIVHFQQSYAAAAKVVTVYQQLFSSVLSALGE